MVTGPGLTLLSLRDLEGRDDLDFRVDVLAASAFPTAGSSVSLLSATTAEADRSEVVLKGLCLLRLEGPGVASSCSSVALRLRRDRDPSSGSPSIMRVLKMECDPGLDVPRWVGSKSLVSLEVEERLVLAASSSGTSGSRALSTH